MDMPASMHVTTMINKLASAGKSGIIAKTDMALLNASDKFNT